MHLTKESGKAKVDSGRGLFLTLSTFSLLIFSIATLLYHFSFWIRTLPLVNYHDISLFEPSFCIGYCAFMFLIITKRKKIHNDYLSAFLLAMAVALSMYGVFLLMIWAAMSGDWNIEF